MTYCCLVPATGPDRFVAVTGSRPTIHFDGITYRRTGRVTHGGWPIYRQEPSNADA